MTIWWSKATRLLEFSRSWPQGEPETRLFCDRHILRDGRTDGRIGYSSSWICYSIDVLSLFWSWLSSDYSFIFILSCDCVRQTSANQYPTCGSPDLYLLWHLDLYLLCDLYLCMLKCRDLYSLYSDDCVGWSGANQSGSCVFSSQTCRETFNPVFSILCTNIPQIWDICTVTTICILLCISHIRPAKKV